MNIVEKLKAFGVEVSEDMQKAFAGDYLSDQEVVKKMEKLKRENEALKERADKAEETLKGFDGKDYDKILAERDEWKKKAEEAEKEYLSKEAEREKNDLLEKAFNELKFTSESAKKAIMKQIAEGVSVQNGKLIGFNDLLDEVRKSDAAAFVDEKQEKLEQGRAKFTTPANQTSKNAISKKDIMEIKDPVERQQKIAENMSLFQK